MRPNAGSAGAVLRVLKEVYACRKQLFGGPGTAEGVFGGDASLLEEVRRLDRFAKEAFAQCLRRIREAFARACEPPQPVWLRDLLGRYLVVSDGVSARCFLTEIGERPSGGAGRDPSGAGMPLSVWHFVLDRLIEVEVCGLPAEGGSEAGRGGSRCVLFVDELFEVWHGAAVKEKKRICTPGELVCMLETVRQLPLILNAVESAVGRAAAGGARPPEDPAPRILPLP